MNKLLKKAIVDSVPLLERALQPNESRYDTDLQLRGSVCGLATGALALYIRDLHGIELDRRIATPRKAPRGLNSRLLRHVVLADGDTMFDPTYSQFFTYVGLSQPATLVVPELRALFPEEKVAAISAEGTEAFADAMAARMHEIEPEVAQRRPLGLIALAPENSLVGTALEVKQDVLRDIWDLNGYEPYSLEQQDAWFQARVLRLAQKMHELS